MVLPDNTACSGALVGGIYSSFCPFGLRSARVIASVRLRRLPLAVCRKHASVNGMTVKLPIPNSSDSASLAWKIGKPYTEKYFDEPMTHFFETVGKLS